MSSSERKPPRDANDPQYLAELELARYDYMRGMVIKDLYEKYSDISCYTLRKYIYHGTPTQEPWAHERKRYQGELVTEARELAKVNASRSYRKGCELLLQIFERVEKKLGESDDHSLPELVQLLKAVAGGVSQTDKMLQPRQMSPLLQIQTQVSQELSPQQIEAKLREQGILILDHKEAAE